MKTFSQFCFTKFLHRGEKLWEGIEVEDRLPFYYSNLHFFPFLASSIFHTKMCFPFHPIPCPARNFAQKFVFSKNGTVTFCSCSFCVCETSDKIEPVLNEIGIQIALNSQVIIGKYLLSPKIRSTKGKF